MTYFWVIGGTFLASALGKKAAMGWAGVVVGFPTGFLASAFMSWLLLLGLARFASYKSKRKN
jgi:hypothetical protein